MSLLAQSKKVDKLMKKGNTALDKNQYVGASVHFTNALAIDPANAQAYYLRGYSFLALDQKSAAEEDLREAIKHDANNIRAYMYLIPLLRDDGRCSEALQYINKLQNISSENVGAAHFQRALCYEEMKSMVEAISSYQKAVDEFKTMGADFKQILEDCQRKISSLRKL